MDVDAAAASCCRSSTTRCGRRLPRARPRRDGRAPRRELFTLVDKKHKIYRKRPWDQRSRRSAAVYDAAAAAGAAERRRAEPRGDVRLVQTEANRVMLDRYSPPGVVVNEDLDIVQFRGKTGRVPRARAGRRQPQPAEAGARGPAARPARRAAVGPQDAQARPQGRPARALERRLARASTSRSSR